MDNALPTILVVDDEQAVRSVLVAAPYRLSAAVPYAANA